VLTGACCNGSTCTQTLAGACATASFRGVGSSCSPLTCCSADYNRSGTLSVQDIFDFLAGYFAQSPAADFNRTGVLSVQDIFDYLSAYFAGCT
jgi:hypothetical protein